MSLPRSRPPFYLEAVPPPLNRGEAGIAALLEKIDAVHSAVGLDGVNIPEIREESSKSERGERRNPFEPRVEPRDLALRVRETFGLECMINRVVVHLERRSQADWFRETWEEFGVRQFVLVGAERSDIRYPGPSVPEANELIRHVIDDAALRVGNICIPTRQGEAARMAHKMRTGPDYFTTQIVYHAREFTELLDALANSELQGETPTLLLTLCPVKSARNIRFLRWLGVSLADELEDWLTEYPETVATRSQAHIERTWAAVGKHLQMTNSPFPVGLNLAPIGRIGNDATVRLARALVTAESALAAFNAASDSPASSAGITDETAP